MLHLKKILRPYLFISCCGILAFAPVSFMLRALKNDIVALEYPINQFISQCIRNGEFPYWFNTWGMGFPLQSSLTWGVYSTPQLFFSSVFDYNIYTLHIEFLFFILLSGWGMFYLLKEFVIKEQRTAQLLSVCYMLSGFMVGSTQWLLYVTAAAFIPLLTASLLRLLNTPSLKNSIQVAVCYTLMFTSVYAAFNIITTYSIILFLAAWFYKHRKEQNRKRIVHLITSGVITLLLCFPCLYFTLELLNSLDRGDGLSADSAFFNSNYLHPGALSSMLFPFSSVRMGYANTEGTMLNSYTGLFLLTMLPTVLWAMAKERSRTGYLLSGAALIFLMISFGDITPLRKILNVIPGFSFFRNPAVFRFYFIFMLIAFTAYMLRNKKFDELFNTKIFRYTLWLLAMICITALILTSGHGKGLMPFSAGGFIKNVTYHQTLFINSLVQLLFIPGFIVLIRIKRWQMLKWFFAADLVINTLLCTPFFSVSSYPVAEVNTILKAGDNFPVQKENPAEVPASFTDSKGNSWQNINVFSKKVSTADSYRGPLALKGIPGESRFVQNRPLVYTTNDSVAATVVITIQRPNHIRANVRQESPGMVTLLQNAWPGWKVFINNKETAFAREGRPGLSVNVPAGDAVIDFRYERKAIWLSALFVHLFIIVFGVYKLTGFLRRQQIISSSPS